MNVQDLNHLFIDSTNGFGLPLGNQVAQVYSFNGSPRKQSIGYKTGNMAAFMYAGSKRKRKKRVKGKRKT